MKLTTISIAVTAALMIANTSQAAELLGKKLEVYGKLHLSVDSVDADNSVSNTSLSSNSSRLGFKGEGDLKEGLQGFYQIESSIKTDESAGTLDGRNTYVGLKGGFGSLLAGYRDTPFKDLRGDFDVFGDTAGDARSIMGSANGTDTFNVRAQNALMYTTPGTGGLKFNLMYSTAEGASVQQGQDNNSTALTSASLYYNMGALKLGVAYEKQKDDDAKGTRAMVKYTMGAAQLGAMYEKLKADVSGSATSRTAYGVNLAYKMGAEDALKLQYVVAKSYDSSSDTGAKLSTIGWDHKLTADMSTYLLYSSMANDANATFGIGGGHDGDKYTTVAGGNIKVLSLGLVYSF